VEGGNPAVARNASRKPPLTRNTDENPTVARNTDGNLAVVLQRLLAGQADCGDQPVYQGLLYVQG
jgi:hypothetical protein